MTSDKKRQWINAIYIFVCITVISLLAIDIFSNLSKTDSRKELKNNITELMYFKDAKEGSDFDEIRVFFESGKFSRITAILWQ